MLPVQGHVPDAGCGAAGAGADIAAPRVLATSGADCWSCPVHGKISRNLRLLLSSTIAFLLATPDRRQVVSCRLEHTPSRRSSTPQPDYLRAPGEAPPANRLILRTSSANPDHFCRFEVHGHCGVSYANDGPTNSNPSVTDTVFFPSQSLVPSVSVSNPTSLDGTSSGTALSLVLSHSGTQIIVHRTSSDGQ